MKRCSICPKEAHFECSNCQSAFYCSKDHQIEHWKDGHKKECKKAKASYSEQLTSLIKKRYLIRKQFFENYSGKVYNICVLDAKVLIDIEKAIMGITQSQDDKYQYGASVCLLVKSYILIKDKINAKYLLDKYLMENEQFLSTLDNIPKANGSFSEKQRNLFQLKMNLISTIANLGHVLEMKCLEYYVLYTKNIQLCFGQKSFQSSNCYFLIGCYLSEEGYFNKAIACFTKSAQIRGSLAGDCYFNIGILFRLQNKLSKAIEMFEKALKLRLEQYGEDTEQIAEINQNLGMIYLELNDFKTAMMEYEKAYKIRSSNPVSKQCQNLIDLMKELQQRLTIYLESDQYAEGKKPLFLIHLKRLIEERNLDDYDKPNKRLPFTREKKPDETEIQKDEEKKEGEKRQKKENEQLLILKSQFIEKLNSTQLFKLSELQIDLQACKTIFGMVSTIGTSSFLQSLSPQNLTELKKDNERLFELIRIEELSKKKK